MTTTDPRAILDEIKARAAAATEGPWILDGEVDECKTIQGPVYRRDLDYPLAVMVPGHDAEHYRTHHAAFLTALSGVTA